MRHEFNKRKLKVTKIHYSGYERNTSKCPTALGDEFRGTLFSKFSTTDIYFYNKSKEGTYKKR